MLEIPVVSFLFHKMPNSNKTQQSYPRRNQSKQWLIFQWCIFLPSISWLSRKGAGPHILTVPSSEALAIMAGICGFQLTQFTVRVCPVSSAMGSSLRLCQMYTLWSGPTRGKAASAAALHTPTCPANSASTTPAPVKTREWNTTNKICILKVIKRTQAKLFH